MLGFDSSDVWWVAVSAFVAAFAGWFAIKTRLGASWLLGKARSGFVDWFGAAIDTHVTPKFEDLRVETARLAAALEERTLANAAASEQRTGEMIRAQVEPLKQTLDERTPIFDHLEETLTDTQAVLRGHMEHDERLRAEDGARLVAGQGELKKIAADNHAEAMGKHAELDAKVEGLDGTVHDHIEADIANFAEGEARDQNLADAVHRIEQRLDTDRPDQPTTTPDVKSEG